MKILQPNLALQENSSHQPFWKTFAQVLRDAWARRQKIDFEYEAACDRADEREEQFYGKW
jgi:hypothetical protein